MGSKSAKADWSSSSLEERDRLVMEWLRVNEAFKGLARVYGKGGRLSKLDAEEPKQEASGRGSKPRAGA